MWSKSAGELAFSSRPDLRILAFNFALTLFVCLLFSLAPAIQFWRPDSSTALKQQTATVAPGSLRLRRGLVTAQIALSLLLLVGAGLFVRTLQNLKALDVGFSTENLLTFGVDPRLAGPSAPPAYSKPLPQSGGGRKGWPDFRACVLPLRPPTPSLPITMRAATSRLTRITLPRART